MTAQEKLVIELVVMSQTKYMRQLAVLALVNEPGKIAAIDAIWEQQKQTLAGQFRIWDERRTDETDGTKP
jgi:hypothetical protein